MSIALDNATSSTRLSKLATLETTLEAMCREAKSEHEISLIKSFSSQPKKLYAQLNRLKSTKSLPLYLQADETQVFDNTVNANIFFNSTFSNSCFKHPPISELPTPSAQLHEISFDSLEVYEVLCKLDATKAMGIDDLHPHLLKLCALMIHEPTTSLFNSKTQLIPGEWKIHKIIPVPKKGDLTLVQNYRPISLLCIIFIESAGKAYL